MLRRSATESLTVAGPSFRRRAKRRVPAQRWVGQPGRDQGVRVTNAYATAWFLPDGPPDGYLAAYLPLWRFERYYQISSDQFPRVLSQTSLSPTDLSFKRWKHSSSVTACQVWLFATPSGQVVAAVSVESSCALADTIDLLEDGYFVDMSIGEESVESVVNRLAARTDAQKSAGPSLLPERHQLVCTTSPDGSGRDDVVQRVIYRANLTYRKEFSTIQYPAELNRRDGWLAAVGPYVSVIGGHPEFIESSIFASVVQAVGAAARLREIRQAAYRDVRLFRGGGQARGSTPERRRLLERISGQLGDMELELSFSVEASADLGLLVPSLRAEGYHATLYESMGLSTKAATTARMLRRLERAVVAELTAIESIERRADDDRRLGWSVAIGFVSVIAIPAGLVLAFFGINASEVNPQRSIFDHQYLPMYLVVTAIVLLGGLLSVLLYAKHRRGAQEDKQLLERPVWTSEDTEPTEE